MSENLTVPVLTGYEGAAEEDGFVTVVPDVSSPRVDVTFSVDHGDMVRALVKSPYDIMGSLTAEKTDLIHAVLGISGEAGELLDAVKKFAIYNKPLDRENVVEELGDLEFYMAQLRQRLSISRGETLAANMEKLSVRYQGLRYSDQAAQDRADKQGVA